MLIIILKKDDSMKLEEGRQGRRITTRKDSLLFKSNEKASSEREKKRLRIKYYLKGTQSLV